MSYDVWLEADTGGVSHEVWSANMTSNVAPMWRDAGIPLREWEGRRAKDCLQPLHRSLWKLNDPALKDHYRAMNPPNGWGTHYDCVRFVADLFVACGRHPEAILRVCS